VTWLIASTAVAMTENSRRGSARRRADGPAAVGCGGWWVRRLVGAGRCWWVRAAAGGCGPLLVGAGRGWWVRAAGAGGRWPVAGGRGGCVLRPAERASDRRYPARSPAVAEMRPAGQACRPVATHPAGGRQRGHRTRRPSVGTKACRAGRCRAAGRAALRHAVRGEALSRGPGGAGAAARSGDTTSPERGTSSRTPDWATTAIGSCAAAPRAGRWDQAARPGAPATATRGTLGSAAGRVPAVAPLRAARPESGSRVGRAGRCRLCHRPANVPAQPPPGTLSGRQEHGSWRRAAWHMRRRGVGVSACRRRAPPARGSGHATHPTDPPRTARTAAAAPGRRVRAGFARVWIGHARAGTPAPARDHPPQLTLGPRSRLHAPP